MLPPFIIDQIRQREEENERREEQPVLEIPIPPREKTTKPREDEPRGVVVIDLYS